MSSLESDAAAFATETEDNFSKRIDRMLLNSFAMSGVALGKKLGLFDVMVEVEYPMTSSEIAEKSGCKERYVREWLHHMVMCDIVDVDETGKNFLLPGHRRKALTDKNNFIGYMASSFPFMLEIHGDIVKCFTKDGPSGVPAGSVFPLVAEFMNCEPHHTALIKCADIQAECAPGLKEKLEAGIRVCDVGCGGGKMLFHLANQFPRSQFTGFEVCTELVEICLKQVSADNVTNVDIVLQDVTELPERWNEAFDWVYMRDVLHDIPYVDKALSSIHRSLKPGGLMSVTEINLSSNPYRSQKNVQQKNWGQMLYAMSIYHCLPLSLYFPGSDGLGIAPGIEWLCETIKNAGFDLVIEPQQVGDLNIHLVFKRL